MYWQFPVVKELLHPLTALLHFYQIYNLKGTRQKKLMRREQILIKEWNTSLFLFGQIKINQNKTIRITIRFQLKYSSVNSGYITVTLSLVFKLKDFQNWKRQSNSNNQEDVILNGIPDH